MTAATWVGSCTACHREDTVGSRRSHGERVLCERCAARPYRMPSADGLFVGPPKTDNHGCQFEPPEGVAKPPELATRLATPKSPPLLGIRGVAKVATPLGVGNSGNPPVPERYTGRVLDVAALLAAPDTPVPWRCEGLAADGYLSIIAGKGGEGKSWLTLALACGVARGQPAAGIECARGRALLFDAENGAPLIAKRLRAAGVAGDGSVVPVDVGGLSFAKDSAWFRHVIDEHAPQLVIFDSLRVLSSGAKESDSDEMEPIITRVKVLARETGCAIILVHHRGKGESEFRGSSVILDQTDLLFTLGRERGDPEGRHRRKIATVKCRIDEEPPPRWVAIQADRSIGRVFVNQCEAFEPEPDRPRDALRDEVLGALTAVPQAAAILAGRVGRAKNDGTVRRVLGDLRADELAEKQADGWVAKAANSEGWAVA